MHGAAAEDEDVFTRTTNPIAEEQKRNKLAKARAEPLVRERKYALPDPSKKQAITQDTPIRVNPTG